MQTNKKILYLLGVVMLIGSIFIVVASSKPAAVDKSAASPEIQNDKETTPEAIAEDLVYSKPLVYFPEKR